MIWQIVSLAPAFLVAAALTGRVLAFIPRLRFKILRLRCRHVSIPQDGAPFDDEARGEWVLMLRAWNDHAGTAAVAQAEREAERAARQS